MCPGGVKTRTTSESMERSICLDSDGIEIQDPLSLTLLSRWSLRSLVLVGIPPQQVMVLQSLRLTLGSLLLSPGRICTLQECWTCLGISSTQSQPD